MIIHRFSKTHLALWAFDMGPGSRIISFTTISSRRMLVTVPLLANT